MNHYVPQFGMDDDCALPASPSRKSIMCTEDEIMELLWQNGQVVVQSQTLKKPQPQQQKYDAAVIPAAAQGSRREVIRSVLDQQHHNNDGNSNNQNHLFMQEDEMASWLHYPLNENPNFDQDFCADFLYSCSAAWLASTTTTATTTVAAPVRNQQPPVSATATVTASRPPIPPTRRPEPVQNFAYFSRHRARGGSVTDVAESGPSSSKPAVRESTVVDSSETPAAMLSESRISEAAVGKGSISAGEVAAAVSVESSKGNNGKERITCEMTVTSSPSPGNSSASDEPPPQQKSSPADDRKRKGREEATEYYRSEEAEFESVDAKKQARGSTSTKRSRAAEVHNLSERRRRDRINEKMRALQELIPRCNKSDKASMLDEAIEYLKSLQLQVQMMSMGCSMVPIMFPGIQQYMPAMGMGLGMGMGMGMEMGMSRPMMPFPNVLAGAPLPSAGAAPHLGPRFPMPAFHMPAVTTPDPTRIQAANQSDHMLGAITAQNPNQPRVPNFVDPYQQYLGFQQMQIPVSQTQAMVQPSTSKLNASQGPENLDNHQSGR